MHKTGPPIYHKLSKLRFLYCCFAWSLLIVMVHFFEYKQWFQSYELLKVTIIQHVKLRKRHLQFLSILTCPAFQKEAPVQTCVDVERSNDAVIGNPLPCCRSKIVTMKPTIASQHQLSCRSAAPLLWQPHPFHDESSLVSTERLSAWARNCLSVWRRIVTTHLCCNLKIGKIPISNSFRAILQNISLWHMGGLCIIRSHILINCKL